VDVGGLDPGRNYTFEFQSKGVTSPTGRTRTLPKGPTKDVVLAVASCTLFPNGYFNAYQAIATCRASTPSCTWATTSMSTAVPTATA
jgi:alkaline phosphatase D